jgi:hypothetical protein
MTCFFKNKKDHRVHKMNIVPKSFSFAMNLTILYLSIKNPAGLFPLLKAISDSTNSLQAQ